MTTVEAMTADDIRTIRVRAVISLEEVGVELGRMWDAPPVDKSTLSRWERGEGELPRRFALADVRQAVENIKARRAEQQDA